MKDNLFISEKFYSIQGEGQTMGIPAIFVRLSGCNILCQSDSWVCDTIEVWRKGTKTPFSEVFTDEEVQILKYGAHLVFTGGEPLMHQKKIVEFIEWFFEQFGFLPIIEVETNGTLMPNDGMISNVEYWNCSPKLANSGEPYERRVKPLVIQFLNNLPQIRKKIIFKFVIAQKEDFIDILQDYGDHLNMANVCLMPAGETQDKLAVTRPIVAELCIQQGIRYSERLHIVIWNQKTGV
jgi:organic radical activating enzyme